LLRAGGDHTGIVETREEIAALRRQVDDLTGSMDRLTAENREQRHVLGDQLSALAGSLDRLVTHLQGLSGLMAELLEILATPQKSAPAAPADPPADTFVPAREGVTLVFSGVPGFQSLMDIQKALVGLQGVHGASIERYQDNESRILLDIDAAVTAAGIVDIIHHGTGLDTRLEEARPDTRRVRIKISPAH
jgi:hypothetical protein